MKANTEGQLPTNLYELFSDRCLHTVTFTSLAMQQLDQVRKAALKPVLPPHFRGLTKLPTGKHAEIIGDDLPARQKELQTKADLAASLVKPPPPPPTKTHPSYQNARRKNKPYSQPTTNATQSYKPIGETTHPTMGQNKVYVPSLPVLFNQGTVAVFKSMWVLITQDPFILALISGGAIQTDQITSEIASLLNKGVITLSTQERCLWISPIFTRGNKDGSSRLILNLKRLNTYIAHIHFKMESLADVLHMITPGVWMALVDLRHAYYSIPVEPRSQPYFSFLWQDTHYQYSCLPNGYAQAPMFYGEHGMGPEHRCFCQYCPHIFPTRDRLVCLCPKL